jgi:hypothetical protein
LPSQGLKYGQWSFSQAFVTFCALKPMSSTASTSLSALVKVALNTTKASSVASPTLARNTPFSRLSALCTAAGAQGGSDYESYYICKSLAPPLSGRGLCQGTSHYGVYESRIWSPPVLRRVCAMSVTRTSTAMEHAEQVMPLMRRRTCAAAGSRPLWAHAPPVP